MGRDYLRAMNGTVVERFFRRDYDEQEDDCKFTRVCPKIPQPGGEHPLPVPPRVAISSGKPCQQFDAV